MTVEYRSRRAGEDMPRKLLDSSDTDTLGTWSATHLLRSRALGGESGSRAEPLRETSADVGQSPHSLGEALYLWYISTRARTYL